MKGDELNKRKEKRIQSEVDLKQATDDGNQDEINKMNKRLTYVTKEHTNDTKRLLLLLGIPIVDAPSEAEAQCAVLCKSGAVYGVATEDMDCLTFGSTIQLRHLTASAAKKLPIVQIELDKVLSGMNINMEQFIQLCVLCGCDYTNTIKGIGPNKALKLIQQYSTIDNIIPTLDTKKYQIPDPSEFLYNESAALFTAPEVTDSSNIELIWRDCDEPGLIQFLCHEKGFDQARVEAGIKRLKLAKNKGTQGRMDSYFTSMPSVDKENKKNHTQKRKIDGIAGGNKGAKGVMLKGKPAATKSKKIKLGQE